MIRNMLFGTLILSLTWCAASIGMAPVVAGGGAGISIVQSGAFAIPLIVGLFCGALGLLLPEPLRDGNRLFRRKNPDRLAHRRPGSSFSDFTG